MAAGLVVGSGGNFTARLPDTDECWVTGAGTWLDRLDRSSFVLVRLGDGAVVDRASTTAPSSELPLHLAIYRARSDVRAIVHLHPQSVLLLDAIGEPVRLATTDHAYYLRRVATVPFAPPGSTRLAESTAAATADGTDCVILAAHGCSVLAPSIELAHKRAMYLEEAARLTYRALAVGRAAALDASPAPDWADRATTA